MKVVFRTNIDAYQRSGLWPLNLTQVPRKGDMVQIKPDYIAHFRGLKLPIKLEVTTVTWREPYEGEDMAEVELWYNSTDLEIAKVAGANPL